MSEDDVRWLSAEVEATPVDAAQERAWATAAQAQFRQEEQRLMAEFRMWKFVRDDAKMRTVAGAITPIRTCLAYLDAVLKEGV